MLAIKAAISLRAVELIFVYQAALLC